MGAVPERLQSVHRGFDSGWGRRLLAVGNAVGAGVGGWECLWGRVRAVGRGEGGTPPLSSDSLATAAAVTTAAARTRAGVGPRAGRSPTATARETECSPQSSVAEGSLMFCRTATGARQCTGPEHQGHDRFAGTSRRPKSRETRGMGDRGLGRVADDSGHGDGTPGRTAKGLSGLRPSKTERSSAIRTVPGRCVCVCVCVQKGA